MNRLLGTQLDKAQMVNILLPLGFGMDGDDIIIPSSRWDMERDCDVAEEVARFVGYNKMPSTAIRGVASARPTERQTFHETLMNALVGYGMYEIETFSFYSRKAFDAVNLPGKRPAAQRAGHLEPSGRGHQHHAHHGAAQHDGCNRAQLQRPRRRVRAV